MENEVNAVCLWWLGPVYSRADRQDVSRRTLRLKNCSVNGSRVYGCRVFLFTAYMCVFYCYMFVVSHCICSVECSSYVF